jgi:hypothetical protein
MPKFDLSRLPLLLRLAVRLGLVQLVPVPVRRNRPKRHPRPSR